MSKCARYRPWASLTLEEAVERARGVSRQALHSIRKKHERLNDEYVTAMLKEVRRILKYEARVARVGQEAVDAKQRKLDERAKALASLERSDYRLVEGSGCKWSVTRDGRVWSHAQCRWLKHSVTRQSKPGAKALYYVGGANELKAVHRIVAKAFLPNPLNLPYVRHKDGDTSNNRADNLEWCKTRKKLDK